MRVRTCARATRQVVFLKFILCLADLARTWRARLKTENFNLVDQDEQIWTFFIEKFMILMYLVENDLFFANYQLKKCSNYINSFIFGYVKKCIGFNLFVLIH